MASVIQLRKGEFAQAPLPGRVDPITLLPNRQQFRRSTFVMSRQIGGIHPFMKSFCEFVSC